MYRCLYKYELPWPNRRTNWTLTPSSRGRASRCITRSGKTCSSTCARVTGRRGRNPSEEALCLHYGVSRGTVRQAIADLVTEDTSSGIAAGARSSAAPSSKAASSAPIAASVSSDPRWIPAAASCSAVGFATKDVATMMGLGGSVALESRARALHPGHAGQHPDQFPPVRCARTSRARSLPRPPDRRAARRLRRPTGQRRRVHRSHRRRRLRGEASRDRGADAPVSDRTTTYTVSGAIAEYRRAILRGDIYRYRIELR